MGDVRDRIKQVLVRLRAIDNPDDIAEAQKEVTAVPRRLKAIDQNWSASTVRRGQHMALKASVDCS